MIGDFLAQNWVDLIYVGIIIVFALSSRGLLATIFEMLSFLFSLLFAYQFYDAFGKVINNVFSLPKGIADALGFFASWMLFESILYVIIFVTSHKYLQHIHLHPLNQKLGYVAAIIQGSLIFLFIITLVFALPVRGSIKNDILKSHVGPLFVNISQSLQLRTKNVFGGAVSEALNFLTVKPDSDETVQLDFKLSSSQIHEDPESEQQMFKLINQERTKRGLNALTFDPKLQELARNYGRVMLENGFFSHVSPIDSSSPGDRAEAMGVEYQVLGENLAFAPDVYLAHQGLMNSPGHRANILGADYGKVGVGVIDGGVYGKMFVQEFSN
jgi:uncharacterized protein YkwD/uncharacterized membrane protein required for colicin V production